jgi:hypothetical protein
MNMKVVFTYGLAGRRGGQPVSAIHTWSLDIRRSSRLEAVVILTFVFNYNLVREACVRAVDSLR